jgi:uncharacterized membrane protein
MKKRLLAAVFAIGLLGCMACQRGTDYVKDHETAQGALIGTGVGAVGGAVVGEMMNGDAAKGAVIGGLGGAAVGAGAGYVVEKDND